MKQEELTITERMVLEMDRQNNKLETIIDEMNRKTLMCLPKEELADLVIELYKEANK